MKFFRKSATSRRLGVLLFTKKCTARLQVNNCQICTSQLGLSEQIASGTRGCIWNSFIKSNTHNLPYVIGVSREEFQTELFRLEIFLDLYVSGKSLSHLCHIFSKWECVINSSHDGATTSCQLNCWHNKHKSHTFFECTTHK